MNCAYSQEHAVAPHLRGLDRKLAIGFAYDVVRRNIAKAIEEATRDGRPYLVRRWEYEYQAEGLQGVEETRVRADAFIALSGESAVKEPGDLVVSDALETRAQGWREAVALVLEKSASKWATSGSEPIKLRELRFTRQEWEHRQSGTRLSVWRFEGESNPDTNY